MPRTYPRVLIVRVGAMGDVIHALAAVASLRDALPGAHVGWAIEPHWESLLRAEGAEHHHPDRMPLVDAVHLVRAKEWNRRPFSPATAGSIAALRRELRAAGYHVAIDLQGTLRSAAIARMSGADQVVGHVRPRERFARLLYRTRVPVTATHVVDQAGELVRAALKQGHVQTMDWRPAHGAGPAHPPEHPESAWQTIALPRDPAAETWWRMQRSDVCGNRPAVLLAATAGWGAKEWPAERFAELAAALVRQGRSVLLNTLPGAVDPVTRRVLQIVAAGSPDLAAHVHPLPATLPRLIAATRGMQAVIAGDTGPLHLAEALGIPAVGLFGPTDPARTGPRHRAVCLRDPVSVTDHGRHPATEAGLARISVAQVLRALQRVT